MLLSRQIDLLSILIEDKHWHTFSEIAQKIHCSSKTVQRDLQVIKDVLPVNWRIDICKGKGAVLYKPPGSSRRELDFLCRRGEITFQIIDILFRSPPLTVTELSSKLYIPVTSLYAHLKKVDQYLQRFGLRLKRKPLSIQGESANLIFMYQEFYTSSYGDHEWAFQQLAERDMEQYILNIEKKLNIFFYPMYKRKLMYMLAILLEHKKKKNTIQLDETFMNRMIDTPFYQNISELNSSIGTQYFLNKEEIALLVIAINCSKYINENLNTYKQEVLEYFQTGTSTICKYIKEFILQLENNFHISLLNNDEFIFAILEYLKYILSKYRFLPRFDCPVNKTTLYIKNQHRDTFVKVWSIYREWVEQYKIQTSISDEEIATLTLHLEGAFMLAHTRTVKVLLLIEDGIKWESYIKGILHAVFNSIFHFVQADIQDIRMYDYSKLDIDVIITTFLSVQSSVPIVRISTIPTNRELHDIRAFIYKN
ncbi:helix-turn-helix domain-containing protein [Bacillus sp. SRB3LM]|uniref:BglG family transcription antiterminator n=1 Tax=Bacillus sp. SRB3LM TaxID=2608689 RepID=UPI0018C378F4|nr:helix-turn-helix domain-containing protein [Bacillus sp. SRB3LM]MBG0970029.1 HTH domain-containing protein [Bacillus sp. SRB3LM]MBG0971030.1 HTH domain-containing protein [Bacillus sp. SRB3LM]